MNVFENSLIGIDNFFSTTHSDEIQRIVAEIDRMDFEGPTVEEYFTSIFFHNNLVKYKLPKGAVTQLECDPPPTFYNQIIIETPKYPVVSQFEK